MKCKKMTKMNKNDRLALIRNIASKRQRERELLADYVVQDRLAKMSDTNRQLDKRLMRDDITIHMKMR